VCGLKLFSRTLCAAMMTVWLAVGAVADVPNVRSDSKSAFEVVENMFVLVRSEFIKDTPPTELVNGAFKQLSKGLEEEGFAYRLPPVPADMSSEEAEKFLAQEFEKVALAYPRVLEDNWLAHQVIEGMIKGLGDRYTVFMNPDEYRNLKESMSGGNFGGVGIYIELSKENGNRLTVSRPIPDSPASDAGIKEGDVILAIDGTSTVGFTIEDAQARLRGAVGSPVTLTIRRLNQDRPFDVVLKRDNIRVSSVTSSLEEIDGHKIGYMRLQMFGEKTDEELEGAMRALENEGAEGYMLDLRNNGGGYIVSAVDVVSKFVPTGSVVTSVEERGTGNKIYRSRPSLRSPKPLILLINQYSASASEITAAALADYEAARLVGVKSFGKGSVQKIFSLPDGSGVKITTAHYHTPTGKDINEVGIEPHEKVEFEGRSMGGPDDTQYQAAAKSLVEKIEAAQALSTAGALPSARTGVEQWRFLRTLGRGEPTVLERRYVFGEGEQILIEEMRVRFPDSTRDETFRFDLGPALGVSG
jgi:carboxyl-terminal processing protease